MSKKREREAEETKKRKIARQRFRNLIRSVMFNRIWLVDPGEQKLSLNVKKNIAMLVRTKRKIGLLTIAEKGIIRTPHVLRTVDERKKLVTLFAGLNCFSKIPPKVIARLVPVIKFMVIGPGRTIIKENDMPITLYFILSGEVEVTKTVFDRLQNEYVDKVVSISGPGDILGEVELLENCPRLHKCTSTTEVEMLVVFDHYFEQILKPVMERQWLDKKSALTSLGYFDYFTEQQYMIACKISQLREFAPLETIYYEDKGYASYVHFVISGECMILQCLKMKVTQKKGKKTFDLVDISEDNAENLFQNLTIEENLKKLKEEEADRKRKSVSSLNIDAFIGNDRSKDYKPQKAMKKMDIKDIEILCGLRKPSVIKIEEEVVEKEIAKPFSENEEEEQQSEGSDDVFDIDRAYDELLRRSKHEIERQSTFSIVSSKQRTTIEGWDEKLYPTGNADEVAKVSHKKHHRVENAEKGHLTYEDKHKITEDVITLEEQSDNEEFEDSRSPSQTREPSFENMADDRKSTQTKTENHFIDVGSMTFGGIFGLGEKLDHRVIMARTTVQCLMIPRFWLFEKEQNPGNAWQRRRFYLDCTIPSRQSLYQDFLTTRRWQKFKNDLIESNFDPNSNANPTKVQDVPIICRIVEPSED